MVSEDVPTIWSPEVGEAMRLSEVFQQLVREDRPVKKVKIRTFEDWMKLREMVRRWRL